MLALTPLYITGFMILFASVNLFAKTNAEPNQKYVLSDLGILKHIGSEANAINDQGEVIGTLGIETSIETSAAKESDEFSPQDNHTFLWNRNKVTDFGRSRAGLRINATGQILGFEYLPDFDLSDPSKMFQFSPILYSEGKWKNILPKGSVSGYPAALNDSGQVVGLLRLNGSPYTKLSPALWSGTDVHLLEIPPAYISGKVTGINNAGQAIGFLQKVSAPPASYETSAVLWDTAGLTLLGRLPDSGQSEAVAINQRGLVLCLATFNWEKFQKYMQEMLAGKKNPKKEGFSFGGYLWDHGKIIPLTDPQVTDPQVSVAGIDASKGYVPRAMNDHDIVVGRAADFSGASLAFIWENHKMIDLNTLIASGSGWHLTEAKDINNKGQIVGQGKYEGRSHAFLLTPITPG